MMWLQGLLNLRHRLMVMWAYYEPADPLIGGVGCLKKNTILFKK